MSTAATAPSDGVVDPPTADATPSEYDGVTRVVSHSRRPCPCKPGGRNLVVCIDAAPMLFSRKNTNLAELYRRLTKSERQITLYSSGMGIGAVPSWKSWGYYKKVLAQRIDFALAWRIESTLLETYLWLSENYVEGDRIFLFGFARGAYQVRALSAMIDAVGLVHKQSQDRIPFAYELYTQTTVMGAEMRDRFKATFSRIVCVHFVGAWDTLSSIGIVRGKHLPGTADGMQHVCYFRHALALHERRVKYLPLYARGGLGPMIDPSDDVEAPRTKEVWFAGSHNDIGGGAAGNLSLDDYGPSFRWMLSEATLYGLQLSEMPLEWEPYSMVNDSLTFAWKILEYIPIRHLTYRDPETATSRPHLGRPRVISPGQKVHSSLFDFEAAVSNYRMGIYDLSAHAVELDHDLTVRRIYSIVDGPATLLSRREFEALCSMTETESGRQTLRRHGQELPPEHSILIARILLSSFIALVDARSDRTSQENIAGGAAHAVVTILEAFPHHRYPSKELLPVVRALGAQSPRRADEVMAHLSESGCIKALPSFRGHEDTVYSVAFLPDSHRLVSASGDATLRLWNFQSDKSVIGSLEGHTRAVRCVAVHGSRIASCSYDGTFCIWDVDDGALVHGPIRAHDGCDINSIAFSPDGACIATGGNDYSAAVWDAHTRRKLRDMNGHTALVSCVAFSKDGRLLASGSHDGSIRIWEVASGECTGEPLNGHTQRVHAICFGPKDKSIFSSSADRTIRIWDAEKRALVIDPVQMDRQVLCIALSPEGRRLVSGSYSGKIALWDAITGEAIPSSFEDHAGQVWSVAFSPDGRKIASASEDMTVGVWDVTDDWRRSDVGEEDLERGDE